MARKKVFAPGLYGQDQEWGIYTAQEGLLADDNVCQFDIQPPRLLIIDCWLLFVEY